MVESCANKITSFLICSKTIEEKDSDLYLYAFKTLIAFIVNIIAIWGEDDIRVIFGHLIKS